METEYLVNHESSRMTAFHLLRDCFFLPDAGLSEKMEDLEFNMTQVCEPAIPLIRNMRKGFGAGADLELLIIDYSKLFVGPYQISAPPYGSVYLEGEKKMMSNSTMDARKRYRNAGLDTAKAFKDAPDHISAELEFMHFLIYKQIKAFASFDTVKALVFIHKQRSFLEDHLMVWVPEFVKSIIEHAKNPFYPNLARATELFLRENYEIVCTTADAEELNQEELVGISSKLQ